MTILHTVNKSPFEKNSLSSCLSHALEGSSVLLMEDGVYGVLDNTSSSSDVTNAMQRIAIYVLKPDLEARGINEEKIISGVKLIDYSGFVNLAVEHNAVQAWL